MDAGNITVGRVKFKNIPDYFLERYDGEIAAWAENFAAIGPIKSIVLQEGVFADKSPDPDVGPQLIQVKLQCKMSARGVEIRPWTERDKHLIALHCEKMQKLNIPSRAILTEPERAGIPFLPDRYN